ncbi:MAG TPA: HDOD domain-containing protein [Holophaga sp.]|jgi:HD-like signal output (HDOD) protein|nr:HDOD domain-containing protein [Holophaga sp.]
MPITPQELIANLGDLPPLPQVAVQVLKIAADPDASTDDLKQVIATDVALTAQILKIANSAMFGMMREVRTLTQAIMTLGFSTIKSVVIASSAKNLYSRGNTGLQERLMWEHALVTALAGRAYGRDLRFSRAEECFLGGLLHDIGKSVLGLKFPDRYSALIRSAYNDGTDLMQMELDVFGFDHAMVGEALLHAWNLASSLESVVRWHHDPAHAPEADRTLVALIALGNRLAHDQKIGIGTSEHLEEATTQALDILGLAPEQLEEHRESVLSALEMDKSLITDF